MSPDITTVLRLSSDPAIRRLAGDDSADVMGSDRVRTLLDFPDVRPYTKWWGTHWRLVALADLDASSAGAALRPGVEQELFWLIARLHREPAVIVRGLVHRCASIEGNAVYACSKLGYAADLRVHQLAESLISWQWPDGGWNCDAEASGYRSSFHETVTPAMGLAAFHQATGHPGALAAARRSAELLLKHQLFRGLRSGDIIHPSWAKLHYPAYWHYDVLQGLRLLHALRLLDDVRASDALDVVEHARRTNGLFSGPAWWSDRTPDAVNWGRGTDNEMLNFHAATVLHAAGRSL